MDGHRENNSPNDGALGDLLKSRMEAFRPHADPAEQASIVCTECGSPLSENTQFCWMCGAIREGSKTTSAVEPRSAPTTGTAEISVAPQQSSRVFPTATEPPEYAIPSSVEPELFSQSYGRDRQAKQSEEDERDEEERDKKFDYRLVAVPLLLAVIVFLAYQQRNTATNFFAMLKKAVSDQIAQLWPADDAKQEPTRTANATPRNASSRKRTSAKPSPSRPSASAQTAHVSTSSIFPLTVKVEGQPGPRIAPVFARVAQPWPAQPAVGVAITGRPFSAAPPVSPMRVQVAPTESLSLLIRQIPPTYPPAAREAGIQGAVVLNVVIRSDGNIGDVSLVSGHPLLVEAAVEAVKQWAYRPYYRDGQPMEVETLVVVEFTLAPERAASGRF